MDPADALASLLLTAGLAAAQIPPGLEARAARWRDHVAGKKILLLLDDAAGHEQVRPLLPGTAGSLVLITSRRRLTALEDAAVISLDTLSPGEAAALLARLAARPGMRAGDRRGGRDHPAVRVPAAGDRDAGQPAAPPPRLDRRPSWPPTWPRPADRLALMHAENLSVAAAFDLSYADLTPGQQRLFRRLGLVPGPSFDAYAAAALDGTSLGTARRSLDELYDQHLLTEPAPGRYQLHDLLREHARALAAADDPAESRRRGRPAAGLLPAHRPGRRPALRAPGQRLPPPAARPPAGAGPGPVHPRAGGRLAGSRARQPARRRGLRRHPPDAPGMPSRYPPR